MGGTGVGRSGEQVLGRQGRRRAGGGGGLTRQTRQQPLYLLSLGPPAAEERALTSAALAPRAACWSPVSVALPEEEDANRGDAGGAEAGEDSSRSARAFALCTRKR